MWLSALFTSAALLLLSFAACAVFSHEHHHAERGRRLPDLERGEPADGRFAHRCIHDSHVIPTLAAQSPLRHEHRSARDGVPLAQRNMQFELKLSDLSTPGKYCAAVGDNVPDYVGGTIACTADTVLTDAKRTELVSKILPAAVQRLSAAFQVEEFAGTVKPSTTSCGSNGITISTADSTTTGITGKDFVLYVAAAPIASSGTIAFASRCSEIDATSKRPLVGKAIFSPKYITGNSFDTDASYKEFMVTTAMHEILHALGFSAESWNSNYGKGGFPLVATTTRRGKTVTYFNGSFAAAAASTHFACSGQSDLCEIEDQGGAGTAGSHTERRLFNYDIMNGIASSAAVLSPITLAIMRDSGYYFPVTAQAGTLVWGNGMGCTFVNDKCVGSAGATGVITNGRNFFCSAAGDGCSYNNRSIGACSFMTHASAIPEAYFRYFTSSTADGGSQQDLLDVCPWVSPYSNYDCTSTSRAASGVETVLGYRFGASSRCMRAPNLIQAGFTTTASAYRCLGITCNSGGYITVTLSTGTTVTCPLSGAAGTVAAPSGWDGTVECPSFADYCTGVATVVPAPTTSSTTSTTTSTTVTTLSTASTTSTTAAAAAATTPAPPVIVRSDPGIEITIFGGQSLFNMLLTDAKVAALAAALRTDVAKALNVPESAVRVQSIRRTDGTGNSALTAATAKVSVIPQNMIGVLDLTALTATVSTTSPAWLAQTSAIIANTNIRLESLASLTNSSLLTSDTTCYHGCRLFIVACIIFGGVLLAWLGFLGHSIYRVFVPAPPDSPEPQQQEQQQQQQQQPAANAPDQQAAPAQTAAVGARSSDEAAAADAKSEQPPTQLQPQPQQQPQQTQPAQPDNSATSLPQGQQQQQHQQQKPAEAARIAPEQQPQPQAQPQAQSQQQPAQQQQSDFTPPATVKVAPKASVAAPAAAAPGSGNAVAAPVAAGYRVKGVAPRPPTVVRPPAENAETVPAGLAPSPTQQQHQQQQPSPTSAKRY